MICYGKLYDAEWDIITTQNIYVFLRQRNICAQRYYSQISLAIQFKIYNLLLNTIKPVGAKSPTGLYINI